jgi:hypothetical protein
MNFAVRPLSAEDYKKLLAEMYKDGKTTYVVDLESDPAANPKVINAKLERVQAFKNRVVYILNQAVANEAYWSNIIKKLDARFGAASSAAMVSEAVKAEKNAESRKAAAEIAAGLKVVETLFKGEGNFTDHYCTALDRRADAQSFLSEVRHVFETLDSADMNLAVQQKNVLMCVRLNGDGQNHGSLAATATGARREQTLEDREEARATEISIG